MTRVVVKVALVLVLSALAAAGGHRALTGRWPSLAVGAGLTAGLFLAVVALDAAIGW
jgi:hypothetical protein